MTHVNKFEVISDCAEVALGIIAKLDTSNTVFPNGLLKSQSNGDTRYTEEAQDVFNELMEVYDDIFSEHLNLEP